METKEFTKNMAGVSNGFLHLFINFVILSTALVSAFGFTIPDLVGWAILGFCLLLTLWVFHIIGFVMIQPNMSVVLTWFGVYSGTIKQNGFFWINPLYAKKKLSLRALNMDVEPIKVNDKNGNPIMIGLVLVWKIRDTYKACFEIDSTTKPEMGGVSLKSYEHFVKVQSDAALRKVAGMYAYDHTDQTNEEMTLRSGGEEINDKLEEELTERLAIAGIQVGEARINYLAYAAEIASVMLRRQQAEAIIAAREKIVEGAVSMVELALNKLQEKKVVDLDDDKKATMVSNLLVVLCADEAASPVINTGTLY
ncbi:MAG: SPFH domain-containing protein [Bacteroidales bacterium]|nr:SPFH domain-containing protein [Bacteroidales bacterium]MDD3858866.1 SPFH domain-containing protein [Bacteroidales bacterium]